MKVVVVIPTYNEVENIGKLIPLLATEFEKMPQHDFHILIVDANSPDGTAQAVKMLQKKFPFVHLLIEQQKAGLGAAYVFGFKHAMHTLKADVLVEMDADLQHDPKDITRLVRELDNGYDYVIGSRFVRGGSIPGEWSLYRKFMSLGGNLFSKIILGLFSVNDFTSGFKVSRVSGFAEKLDLDSILSKGFAYKIDLLYRMHKLGAKFKEVPIAFGLRDLGSSKMEKNNFSDSLKVVLTIRFNQNKSFFRFVVVGFIGLGTDLILFNLLRISFLPSAYASAVSGLVAMTVTYICNNHWSFNDRKIKSFAKTVRSLAVYYVSSYIPIVFRSWFVGFAISQIADTFLVSNFAFGIGVVLGLIWNFTVYSRIIWR